MNAHGVCVLESSCDYVLQTYLKLASNVFIFTVSYLMSTHSTHVFRKLYKRKSVEQP